MDAAPLSRTPASHARPAPGGRSLSPSQCGSRGALTESVHIAGCVTGGAVAGQGVTCPVMAPKAEQKD